MLPKLLQSARDPIQEPDEQPDQDQADDAERKFADIHESILRQILQGGSGKQGRRLGSHQHDPVYETGAFLNRATSAV